MNRAIWNIADPPPADLLPPATRRPGEPVRVLFIQASELGFLTTTRSLEAAAARRTDIDAVHISGKPAGWRRLLAAQAPFPTAGLDQHPYRYMRVWASILKGLFSSVLPPDRFDVIHIMPQQRGLVVPWLRRRTKASIVVNIDATIPAYCRAFHRPIPRLSLAYRAEQRTLAGADMLACWSRWAADSAVMEMGVSPERVVLHKPCIDRPAQLPSAPPPSPERDVPARRVRIAFVGNDFERKGGDRLLRWHQARWRTRAEIHVCSAKVQPDRSLEGVIWHGATPHAKLTAEILPSCDLFVMPTREDTFLIAAQEALVAGLPVITSRLAGIPEVVRDERTGFLCAPDDESGFIAAIERLLDDPSLRANMSRAAREHAERNLSGQIWHNHLLDQLVALAEGRPTRYAPEGVDIRNSEREPGNPASQAESVARAVSLRSNEPAPASPR